MRDSFIELNLSQTYNLYLHAAGEWAPLAPFRALARARTRTKSAYRSLMCARVRRVLPH